MHSKDELERQAFEKWTRQQPEFMDLWLDRDRYGKYYWDQTHYEWNGWLARSKQEQSNGDTEGRPTPP